MACGAAAVNCARWASLHLAASTACMHTHAQEGGQLDFINVGKGYELPHVSKTKRIPHFVQTEAYAGFTL